MHFLLFFFGPPNVKYLAYCVRFCKHNRRYINFLLCIWINLSPFFRPYQDIKNNIFSIEISLFISKFTVRTDELFVKPECETKGSKDFSQVPIKTDVMVEHEATFMCMNWNLCAKFSLYNHWLDTSRFSCYSALHGCPQLGVVSTPRDIV